MKTQTFKLKLGQHTLSVSVGDKDANGCIDFSFGIRIVGLIEFSTPPVNLDAKLVDSVIGFFEGIASAVKAKRQ